MQNEYTHLSRLERDRIVQMRSQRRGIRDIARKLNRAPSSISRELRRNFDSTVWGWESLYDVSKAGNERALARRSRKRPESVLIRSRFRAITVEVSKSIEFYLSECRYSPEDISSQLWIKKGLRLSGQTIRRWIKTHRKELRKYLPRRGKKYKFRIVHPVHPRDRGKRSVHLRPEAANQRVQIGHFEADCIVSSHNTASLLVIEDRAASYTFIRKVPNLQSETIRKALFDVFLSLPEGCRLSCTFDNGPEFSCHLTVQDLLKIETYFCDPYKSWQKGSVENKNSRIRRYLPKGTDLTLVSEERLREIEFYLNDRPVQRLGRRSAADVWNQQLQALIH